MEFDKYQAAGNDFIIFNGIKNSYGDYGKLALKVCHRQLGIGADGILVCEKSQIVDIKMRYFNSDGTEGEMCGNGIRCFSKYIYDNKIITNKNFKVETLGGIKDIRIETDEFQKTDLIIVDMEPPILEGKNLPINMNKNEIIEETIEIQGNKFKFSFLVVGVPHVVIFIDNIKGIDINNIGRQIEEHNLFPEKTNVNFVKVNTKSKINIYTWERGAGRTLGCGTGSCASVVIGNILGILDSVVEVDTEGGSLKVYYEKNKTIYMEGKATHIAKGKLYI